MFIELIPQRKSHGGGRRGEELGIFFLLLQKIDFFFLRVCWMEKNLQNNFAAGKQFDFLLCCSPKEEFTPCVGFLPRWGWKGPFPSHGMCKRFHVEHAGCTSAEHSDWFDWDVSSKNTASL